MLHRDQNIDPFCKGHLGRTKYHANKINTLTRIKVTDATHQACQDLLKAPFLSPTSSWHLQLARVSTVHMDQNIQPFLKGHWRQTRAHGNIIKSLTRVNVTHATLQSYQDLINTPLMYPTSDWHLQLRRAYIQHLEKQAQPFLKWI